MTKGQKSSASSGTRKKNARKAAQAAQGSSSAPPPSPVPKQSKPKGGKKVSKREAKEQRKKAYIPPIKPAPPVPDPLDTTGLVHLLPPELVVVLRALGKKDVITRGKAIEEVTKLVEDAIREQAARDYHHDQYGDEGGKAGMVVKMLPVWVCLQLQLVSRTTNTFPAPSCPGSLHPPIAASSPSCCLSPSFPPPSQCSTRSPPCVDQRGRISR